MRDDFSKSVKDLLGNRVGWKCSKSTIASPVWREKLDTICDMLVALRKRLKIEKKEGAYSTYGEGEVMYCFYDRNLEEWFDFTREEILKILSSVCEAVRKLEYMDFIFQENSTYRLWISSIMC